MESANAFAFMADLLRLWLGQARTSEIADVLDLIGQELQRRGVTLRVILLRSGSEQRTAD